jgi:TetR/AcrR family transcriptional regulator, lmrAB and yxaGH operons repressor
MANDTRTRMLEATGRLLRQRGYHGTSLNDILAESGAPRGSLYFHFPGGKDQLVIEVTRASVAEVAAKLREQLAAAKSPAVAVRRIAEATAEMLKSSDYARSCPVAPVVLDSTTDIPELIELCRRAFEEWIGLFRDSFAKSGIPDKRARSLAMLVEASLEGMMVICRATRDYKPMLAVADELATVLEAAVAEKATSTA